MTNARIVWSADNGWHNGPRTTVSPADFRPNWCEGTRSVRRYRADSTRYLACTVCGADVTELDDYYADRVGRPTDKHTSDQTNKGN